MKKPVHIERAFFIDRSDWISKSGYADYGTGGLGDWEKAEVRGQQGNQWTLI